MYAYYKHLCPLPAIACLYMRRRLLKTYSAPKILLDARESHFSTANVFITIVFNACTFSTHRYFVIISFANFHTFRALALCQCLCAQFCYLCEQNDQTVAAHRCAFFPSFFHLIRSFVCLSVYTSTKRYAKNRWQQNEQLRFRVNDGDGGCCSYRFVSIVNKAELHASNSNLKRVFFTINFACFYSLCADYRERKKKRSRPI